MSDMVFSGDAVWETVNYLGNHDVSVVIFVDYLCDDLRWFCAHPIFLPVLPVKMI